MRIAAIIVALILAGCDKTPPLQPVNIVSSDLCQIQPKRLSWDVKDTPETIKGNRQFNARWNSRCGKARPTS